MHLKHSFSFLAYCRFHVFVDHNLIDDNVVHCILEVFFGELGSSNRSKNVHKLQSILVIELLGVLLLACVCELTELPIGHDIE